MDDEIVKLTGQEAIKYIADNYGIPSMYALAKALSDEQLTVQPIQISNYINGKRMGRKVADRFYAVYDIIITDVFENGNLVNLGDKL